MKIINPLTMTFASILIGLAGLSSAIAGDNQVFAFAKDDPALEWGPCTDVADFFPEGCKATILQGNPAERYADVLMRIPANTRIATHYHTSAERMVLIAGEFHIHPKGQDTVAMQRGYYAYGPAMAHHSAKCVSDVDCYLFIAFEGPVDAIPVDR